MLSQLRRGALEMFTLSDTNVLSTWTKQTTLYGVGFASPNTCHVNIVCLYASRATIDLYARSINDRRQFISHPPRLNTIFG
jgi:hypothetical protein